MKLSSKVRFPRFNIPHWLGLQGALMFVTCLPVTGAIVNWTGAGGDGSASTSANWGGATPANGDAVQIVSDTGGATVVGFDTVGGPSPFTSALSFTFLSSAPQLTVTAASTSDTMAITSTGTALANNSNFQQFTTNPLTLQVGAATQTWDGGANGLKISNIDLQNNHTLTLTGTGTTSTTRNEISNKIDGTGASGVVKAGSGTLLFTGSNSYTGSTSVTGGILQLGAGERIANTSNLLLSNGAMLRMANFTETVGTLTIGAGGAIIDFGVGAGNNSLILLDSSASSWAAGLTILNFNTGDSLKIGSSNGALTPSQLSNIIFQTGTATNGSGSQVGAISATGVVTPTTVPEPASAMLIGLGLMAIAFRRRQRCG